MAVRTIIFRGKRIDNGEWVEGNLFVPDKVDFRKPPTEILMGTNIVRISYEVDPETVGQYTGLKDKNGKRVFEGDICQHEKTGRTISVSWHGTMAGYVWSKRIEDSHLFDFGELFRVHDKYAVIGNIHDNPELLEVR